MAKPQIDLKFGADLKDFRRGISNIDSSLKQLSGGFTALGGVIGASFAVDAIRQFVSESVELGATMEGVRGAFARFADPSTLDNLRDAVSGTVDDLKLMQMAVRAKNFKIPMDVLAKGLKFATQRAVETGESVDYLVESFVIGLGRESVKILDNLGISTLEIQRKTKEMGDMTTAVGAIMDEEFSKAGERVVTTSMKIDQQRAAVANLKTEIGEKLAPIYMSVAQGGLEFIKAITNSFASFTQAYGEMFRAIGLVKREQDRFGESISQTGKQRIDSEEQSLFRLNAMLTSLQDNNLAEDQRRILINKINTEYKDYLPNLLSEKDTLEDIRDVAKQVNKTAREKINQIIYQEKINKATEDGVQAQKDLNRLTIEQSEMIARGGYYAMTIEQLRELGTSGKNMGHDFRAASSEVITMNKNIDDARDRLSRSEIIIEGYTKRLKGSTEATEEFNAATEGQGENLNEINEKYFMAGESMRQYTQLMDEMSQTAPMSFAKVTQSVETFVSAGQKMQNVFMGVSDIIGSTLTQSFESALTGGESFFKTFGEGLKAMLAQIIAVIAATAVLALVLTLATGGLAGLSMESFGTAFKAIGGGMGVPSFMMPGGLGSGSQSIEIFGRLSGADILLSGERAGRERTRQRGF